MGKKFFITGQGIKLPVSEKKYLVPFLTSTSKGTNYFETPKNIGIKNDYLADKLLQLHQFLDILNSLGIKTNKKSFIDIGTGNGLIPKFLLMTNYFSNVLGTDKYSPYEHQSANIPVEDEAFIKFSEYLKKKIKKNFLTYSSYEKDIKGTAEKEVFRPYKIKISKIDFNKVNDYKFKKLGADELHKLRRKYDFIYCKGIEHIPNWKKVVKNISSVSRKKTFVYIKTRPFFSYLGPHRFATTAIPWGHALLNDREYVRYVNQFHKERKNQMINSYFNTLTIPRYSSDQLIKIFESFNYSLICKKVETPPYIKKINSFKKMIPKFNTIIKNKKNVTNEDLSSSIQHLVFQKN